MFCSSAFSAPNRREPPDIDVDFEHERREEVIQYIYRRYGHRRAALTATVICYRPRSAIREVGKVFGLTEDVTGKLADTVWGHHGDELQRTSGAPGRAAIPHNALVERAVHFAKRLIGFPRHLSQHVGGFVLTARQAGLDRADRARRDGRPLSSSNGTRTISTRWRS